MKQISRFMAFAAIAAAFVSCAKEMEKPVAEAAEGIEVTINAGVPETKTYVEGLSPFWKASDAIGVFTGADETNAKFTNTLADGKKGAFTGTVPAVGTYYAYYPYSNIYGANANGVSCKFPEEQHPTPTSFDGAADFLVSEAFEVTSTEAQTLDKLKFTRLGAFLKFSFIDGTSTKILSGEYATEVKVIVNLNVDGDYRPCPPFRITPEGIGTVGEGVKTIKAVYDKNVYELTKEGNAAWFGIRPNTFAAGNTFDLTISTSKYTITKALTLPSEVAVNAGDLLPINVTITDSDVAEKSVKIETVWSKMSSGSTAWNTYYGGTGNSDRNIAMDDDYVYIAESSASAKLWAISLTDPTEVKAVNVEGVSGGGAHVLSCPRVIKNESASINGGKDVLACASLTRGGVEPKIYFWLNGIDNAPVATTLVTSATDNWYGDTFTVYGTLQDGILFFDKTDSGSNGIVTFDLAIDESAPEKIWLHKRIAFKDAFGSHDGVCAYYPFPGNVNAGIYSPGRGAEKRGQSVAIDGDLKSSGNSAFTPTLTALGYCSGRHTYVLAYNFVDWLGKRYIIYGKQESSTLGKVYILEGPTTLDWLTIINRDWDGGEVKFRRDIQGDGTLFSGNSAMDITARIINGDLYIAAQKQNIGCVLYRLYYE